MRDEVMKMAVQQQEEWNLPNLSRRTTQTDLSAPARPHHTSWRLHVAAPWVYAKTSFSAPS